MAPKKYHRVKCPYCGELYIDRIALSQGKTHHKPSGHCGSKACKKISRLEKKHGA